MCRVRWVRHRAGLGPPVPVSGRAVRLRWAGLQPECPGVQAGPGCGEQSRAGSVRLSVSRDNQSSDEHTQRQSHSVHSDPALRYKQEKLGHFNIELRQLVIKAVWGAGLPAGVVHSCVSPCLHVSGVSCLVSVSCVCVSGLHRPELGAPHQVLVLTVCLWVPGEGGQGAGEERSCSELSECKYRNVQCVVQPASGPGPVISPVFVSSELVVTSTSLCLSPACVVTAEGGENVSLKCSNYAKFDQSLTESPRDIVTSPRSQHTLHTELITLRILPRSLITNLAIFVWSASVAVQAE